MPKITIENLTKKFGNFTAVNNLNMVIEDRGFVTLLGPSGCGKTTVLRMIAGLTDPTSGRITIGDTVVFDSERNINVPPDKRDVGFIFQNYALWPHMTVYKNISFGLENLKWKKEDIDNRVKELLDLMQISELGGRYPSELSGGQQQRVAIARTLAPHPKILFMDEPLSNLDAKLRLEMRTELKRLHAETDATFIYVTHDQLEAMTLATKICLMNAGEVVQYDSPLYTYAHPVTVFSADFIGNPTINFLKSELIIDGNEYKILIGGKPFAFKPVKTPRKPLSGRNIVIGIRPEHIKIGTKGLKGKVYSSLPSGMETILLLKFGKEILTSVVFGIIDFEYNSEVNFTIGSDNIIIFDAETEKNIMEGTIVF
ncbi:MAG: ABC transporter ATP-binding protein [Bacilli bacterium]|jgi:multiple sugar transport system ATP-binding protein